jgi:hypothetical protein
MKSKIASFIAVALFAFAAARTQAASPEDLFNARILPIFRSPDPSSCVQCHLSAVDLKDYILPSSEATFASLKAQELIDVDVPEESRILKFISMGEKDYDKGARMIHADMRQAELAAFSAWIKACCDDPRFRNLPAPDKLAKPASPDKVIRHARKSRLVDSFKRNIWSHRMRCFPCHTPYEIDDANPKHKQARQRLKKMKENNGVKFTSRLKLFKKTPEATMEAWIESSRDPAPDRLPLINIEAPVNSLIVLKPSARLPKQISKGKFEKPSAVMPVSHLGGIKMHKDDFSYKSFIAWIQDYADVVNGEYTAIADLPADNWHPSKHMIMLNHAPKDWPNMTPVQLFVHRWDAKKNAWAKTPIAFTQGKVTPKKAVFGALSLLRDEASENAADWTADDPTLQPGNYLIKVYLDSDNTLQENPIAFLDDKHFRGQIEIQAHWGKTFPKRELVNGENLRK